jgi:hypothetical protein
MFREWSVCKKQGLQFANRDSWDRMLEQGIGLLIRFCQDGRVHVPEPAQNLQVKISRALGQNEFIAYIDAIGQLDSERCLLEWKTSSSRYPERPPELLTLDTQLLCYSWLTGIPTVAEVVFVRKRVVEVQYLQATITDTQREEFGQLVKDTIERIEAGQFLPHSGIRFPQNPCLTCPYVGLCLGRQDLAKRELVRRPGAEAFDWINELAY